MTPEGTSFDPGGLIKRPPAAAKIDKRCSHCEVEGKKLAIDRAFANLGAQLARVHPRADGLEIARAVQAELRKEGEARQRMHQEMEMLGTKYANPRCQSCGGSGVITHAFSDPPWTGYVVGTHPDNECRVGDGVAISPDCEYRKSWHWNPHRCFGIADSSIPIVLVSGGYEFAWPDNRRASLIALPEAAVLACMPAAADGVAT